MKRYILSLFLLCVVSTAVLAQSAPTCVQGASGVAPTATLTFTPPTANTDGSALSLPLTYNLYQSTTSGSEVLVTSALKGSPIAVSTGVTPKTTYYWKISVTDAGGNVSLLSNEVCKTFPASVPGTVTITIS